MKCQEKKKKRYFALEKFTSASWFICSDILTPGIAGQGGEGCSLKTLKSCIFWGTPFEPTHSELLGSNLLVVVLPVSTDQPVPKWRCSKS